MPLLAVDLPLRRATRLPTLTGATDSPITAAEMACLIGLGLVAGVAAVLPDGSPKIPGHAILRSILPCALGLALVPRRGAGTIIAASAWISVLGVVLLGRQMLGIGASVSLTITGPLLDLALFFTPRRSNKTWPLHLAFVIAGAGANLLAFAARAASKGWGWDLSGKPLEFWAPAAIASYVACGVAAGLISGLLWFRIGPPSETDAESNGLREEAPSLARRGS